MRAVDFTRQPTLMPLDGVTLAYYRLHRDPFFNVNNSPDQPQFTMPQWKETLELLSHFIQYSKFILLVQGPIGIGKTHFKHHVIQQTGKSLRIGELSGDASITASNLAYKIGQAFGITLSHAEAAFELGALELLARLKMMEKGALLFIDNAHLCNAEVVASLCRLYSIDESLAERLRIILLSRPEIQTLLNKSSLKDLAKLHTHTMVLTGMSEAVTKHYIEFCLLHAGWQGACPFSASQLKQIFQSSQGVPGLVNYLAAELLTQQITRPKASKQGALKMISNFVKKHPWRIISCLVLSATASSLFLLKGPAEMLLNQPIAAVEATRSAQVLLPGQKSEQEASYHMPEVATAMQPIETNGQLLEEGTLGLGGMNADISNQPAQVYPQEAHAITLQRSIDPTSDGDLSEEDAMSAADVSLVQTPPLVGQKATLKAAPNVEQAEIVPAPSVTPQPTLPATPTPKMTENTPVATQPVVAAAQTEAVVETPVTIKRNSVINQAELEKALLNRPGSHYTIQLAGAVDEKALVSFKKQHAIEKQGIIVRTTRDDHDWFVLLYGDYSNQQDAVVALRQLPEPLRSLKPWPRQMSSIQAMIQHRS